MHACSLFETMNVDEQCQFFLLTELVKNGSGWTAFCCFAESKDDTGPENSTQSCSNWTGFNHLASTRTLKISASHVRSKAEAHCDRVDPDKQDIPFWHHIIDLIDAIIQVFHSMVC